MKLDGVVALVLTLLVAAPTSAVAWEPTKPIDFVVPAGTGGGADQMARLIFVQPLHHAPSHRHPVQLA